jgi:hypothetical protein
MHLSEASSAFSSFRHLDDSGELVDSLSHSHKSIMAFFSLSYNKNECTCHPLERGSHHAWLHSQYFGGQIIPFFTEHFNVLFAVICTKLSIEVLAKLMFGCRCLLYRVDGNAMACSPLMSDFGVPSQQS